MKLKSRITDYIESQYGVGEEHPWEKYPEFSVFRHLDNHKWFALTMEVRRDVLALAGEGKVDVINLKIDDPVYRDVILQDEGIMPGYHMNKEHWITVLLDGTVPEKQIRLLLDISFQTTSSRHRRIKERPAKEWLVPANPAYYDILHAFDNKKEIEWKQGAGIQVGDTVYLYVGAPVSAVLFRCRVTQTDIPYDYQDKNLTIRALMKIRLQKKYTEDEFPFRVLKDEYGVNAIRGPRGVPHSLSWALNGKTD